MKDKVVVTGTGLVSALGLSASETWDALLSLNSGIRQIEGAHKDGFPCGAAARVHGLDAHNLNIHPRDSRIMGPHSFMLMKASRDAFRSAGLGGGAVASEEIGYFAGMGMVDYAIDDLMPAILESLNERGKLDYDKFFSAAYQQIHPLWPLSMLNNISFCQTAIDLGIKGENTTFCPHADSGMDSIIEAYYTALEKRAKVVLAGGVSEVISPSSMARASWFNLLNTTDSGCRPFGKDRRGTILGEGAGILSIELASTAAARNVSPLAVIRGFGASFEVDDKESVTTPYAISLSMEMALDRANLRPSDIGLIIAHGDGTFGGDRNEIDAIHGTFGDSVSKVNVFASKGALGNLLAGASAVDVILGIYMLNNGIIPATYGASPCDERVRFDLVTGEPLKKAPGKIMINSSSYEGQCASLIIEAVA